MHGRDSFEIRPRRRQGRAAASFWHGGDRWLRHEFVKGSSGFGRGAHGGVVGDLSVLGDGLVTMNRSTTAVGAEDEDGVDDGVPGRPAPCVSEEMA